MKQEEKREEKEAKEIPDRFNPVFRGNFKQQTNDREIVRLLMKKKGLSYTDMADKAGYTNKANIWNFLKPGGKTGMTTDVLVKMLRAMHCDIAIFDLDDGTEYDIELLSEQEGDQE